MVEHDSTCAAQVYDSLEQRWLPAQAVAGNWHEYEEVQLHAIQFCDSEQLGVATAMAEDSPHGRPDLAVLVVFGVQAPSVTLAPVSDVSDCRWLPGTTSLLVLSKRGLARLDLDPAALPAAVQLQWTSVPELPPLGRARGYYRACLELVPGTDRALLLAAPCGGQPAEALLTLVETSGLVRLSSWCKTVECPSDFHRSYRTSLHCSWSAVAVCVGDAGFQVHQLDQGRVGALIFVHRSPFDVKSFSPCGCFVAGVAGYVAGVATSCGLTVLDMKTGHPLVQLEPGFFNPKRAADLEVFRLAWAASGKLDVAAKVFDSDQDAGGPEVLFATVTFA